jgi:hypothetical protein
MHYRKPQELFEKTSRGFTKNLKYFLKKHLRFFSIHAEESTKTTARITSNMR